MAEANSHGPHEPREKGPESKRDREFRRYAEAVLEVHASEDGDIASSSADVSLTAFAQLVALRLNAKRAIISLFDKNWQYVLAEATRTLSLQQDHVHDHEDGLHFGKNVLKRENDFLSDTLKVIRTTKRRPSASIDHNAIGMYDMANDERSKSHRLVTGPPYVRSYAGVPLLNRGGFAVGSVAILDDKPRDYGLTDEEIHFMTDVATSIIGHLDMKRIQTAHARGLRLVHGLSRFIEGKDSLDADDLANDRENPVALNKRQTAQTAGLRASARTEAMNTATNAERMYDAREAEFNRGKYSTLSERRLSKGAIRDASMISERKMSTESTSNSIGDPEESASALNNQGSPHRDDAVSQDVPEAFERAAKILKQAMKLETVLFLDASASSFGSLHSSKADDVHSPHSDSSSASTLGGDTDAGSPSERPNKKQPCRYLARAYEATGSHRDRAHHRHSNIPERFLRSILKRFAHGKIYNFGDDGLMTSSDFSDGMQSPGADAMFESKRLRDRRSDSKRIQQIFPGVRCVGIMPMYDTLRSQFYAGAVVLSYDSQRLFSFKEDMNYLGAFCDVVMAEIGRLDIQADVQAKTSFISSISHELRSPLHGILGGVDCLQDESASSSTREEMLHMIDTCGRSLLDIVNNLLDHSDAHQPEQEEKKGISPYRRKRRKNLSSTQSVHDLSVLSEEVMNSALWSTLHPTRRSKYAKPLSPIVFQQQLPIKVALDIDMSNLPDTGWRFRVNSGAWRRILQNLTSNSIKYTDEGGYLQIHLAVGEQRGDARSRIVTLRCTDSGRGMSKHYVQNGLWQAFNQEDSHASGTGLGLSLVHGLVHGMGGTIDVQSEQGSGTTITMHLPLMPANTDGHESSIEGTDTERIRRSKYRVMGFDPSDDHSPRAAESMRVLRVSVESVCESVGMTLASEDNEPDVYVVTEEAALLARTGADLPFLQKPTIVLCDSVTSARASSVVCAAVLKQARFVSQPLGPTRLSKTLTTCFTQEDSHLRSANVKEKARSRRPSIMVTPQVASPVSSSPPPPVSSPPPLPEADNPESSSVVLVVDDNTINLTLLQRYMNRLGRSQIGATNGQEAFDAYQTSPKPVRVVFMDINMPVMDGLESTRRIRAYERSSGIKKKAMIVALTAMASPSARQEAFSSGVDLFLTKPVQFKDIEGLFRDWEGAGKGKENEGVPRRPESARRGYTTG